LINVPSVNEIFNPSRISDIYSQSPQHRHQTFVEHRSTNYGVVRLSLIEKIYEKLYTQRIIHGNDEAKWPTKILPFREVISIQDSAAKNGSTISLHIKNTEGEWYQGKDCGTEVMDVDAVFVATGYKRDLHEILLRQCRDLMPQLEKTDLQSNVASAIDGYEDSDVSENNRKKDERRWGVRRDYSVIFEKNTVNENAGVWLQGCCERTHGVSAALCFHQLFNEIG
jgi:L-ornithine N5-monooxygenase